MTDRTDITADPLHVELNDTFRDDLARALIAQRHREIAEELQAEIGQPLEQDYCGGQTFDPPCGGCGLCMLQQLTYADRQEPEFSRWRAQADELLVSLRSVTKFRARHQEVAS